MPLPDAPPPRSSRVYQQTTGKTLQSLTVGNLDTISDPVFLDRNSEDELRRINLVGQASNLQSQSGPISGTQNLLDTDSISNSEITVHKPESGQVWQLVAASITTLDGASTMILKLNDDTSTPGVQIDTFNSTSNPIELNEPIFYTSDVWLKVRTSDASGGNARLATSSIRVR